MNTPIPTSKILLPLYIYPNPGAWQPLYKAIQDNPTLDIVVIINPNNGPGSEPWWPNADYVRELPNLNAHANVRTVGYVHTTYCERPIEQVLDDIERYSKWSEDAEFPGLGLSGIFFDETPNEFSQERKWYLDTITQKVNESEGLLEPRMVIHNPGTTIDARLASPGLSIATVAELSYLNFNNEGFQDSLKDSDLDRTMTSHMIHSVPEESIEAFVTSLREKAGYIYVTDLETEFYHTFGPCWRRFIDAMARHERGIESGEEVSSS